MSGNHSRLAVLAVAGLFIAAACASDEAPTASQAATAVAAAALEPIEASDGQPGSAETCAPGEQRSAEHPAWPVGGSADPEILPIVMSSLVTVGPNRFLFNVTDSDYRIMAAPEIATAISFYALERDPDVPAASVEGTYLDTQLGRGLYRATIEFDCAGEWGADVTVTREDGSTASERLRFQVHPSGTTPAIGAAAPRSDSRTASTIDEVRLISTDPNPFPGAYERTVAEVVSSGRPSLVFFATPAFCQTGYCGPTVNLVKSVAIDYQQDIGFVNVEPYELAMTENGLQPVLDENGHLQPVQAVLDYGIPVEPYLFLVDADGDVFAKFEGVVGADELRAAIEDVLTTAS